MKVEINGGKDSEKKSFPRLMINKHGCIRIVYKDFSSAVIRSRTDWNNSIADADDWDIEDFTDFTGSIILSNN